MERATQCETGQLRGDDLSAGELTTSETGAPAKIHVELDEAQPFLLSGAEASQTKAVPQASQPAPVTAGASTSGRLLDVTAAALILLLVLPLMAACALAVMLSSPGPLLFRQTRIGRNGREFICLKFRTMTDRAEDEIDRILNECSSSQKEWAAVYKLRSDPRVTPTGRFLRRYCLDELPQLFNVLKGDMSIVGPRPIVAAEVHRYGPNFADYCKINPGLTGLWQVSGLHDLPYEERVRLDVQYANSKSLRLDMLILLKTVPIVLLGENH